jgi:hypothetical protein
MMINFTGESDGQTAILQKAGKMHKLPPGHISRKQYKIPFPQLQSETGLCKKREAV